MNRKFTMLKVNILFLFLPTFFICCNSKQINDSTNQKIIEKSVEFEPKTIIVQDIDFEENKVIDFKENGLIVSLNTVGAYGGYYSYTLPDLISENTSCVRVGETICSDKSKKYQVCFTALQFSETNKTAKTRITLRQIKE